MLIMRRVHGNSMLPTLKHGQIVIALKAKKPKLSDVVIFDHLGREKIKRLAGLSAKGYYVVGDNLEYSEDSRSFGAVSPQHIKAVVFWPKAR